MPRLAGLTSWDQYRQVFDAIVVSNGWDDVTAALQLFSHLEGDALNVALLVLATRRASQMGLIDALTAHYGSPGQLADYRRQFERVTRAAGMDRIGSTSSEGLWGYGPPGTPSVSPGSVYNRAGCTSPTFR